jgi:predicted O-methyltransferase YrrM
MFRRLRRPADHPAEITPRYGEMSERVPSLCHEPVGGEAAWYPPVMLGASALAEQITNPRQVERARDLLQTLAPDEYGRYMIRFYEDGLRRFGGGWRYADIVTVLLGLTEALKPRRYLEIGVRRGRSACAVASLAPTCDLALFDMWIPDYAGMENPGPAFVRAELARVGHSGRCDFVDGDSHETLPRYFSDHPDTVFDLITVDGDHSDDGATRDLCDVLPRLAVGGAVVFDDISHPAHPGLKALWHRLVVDDSRFSAWSFDEVGYGVGFGVRKR